MKVTLDVSKSIDALGIRAAQERQAAAAAITGTVRELTFGIRKDMRATIRRALGGRAANTLAAKVTPGPSAPSLTPLGRVYSRWINKKRPGGPVDVLSVFQDGATITAGGKKWLAIPQPAAGTVAIGGHGRLGDRAPRPSDFKGLLAFVAIPGKPNRALLVTRRAITHRGNAKGEVLFVLVRQARVRGRFDLRAIYDRRVGMTPAIVARQYAEARQKAGVA